MRVYVCYLYIMLHLHAPVVSEWVSEWGGGRVGGWVSESICMHLYIMLHLHAPVVLLQFPFG